MAILKSIPRLRKLPSFRNVMMVDVVKGQLRVRKWPKKRGKAKSALQQYWIDWFTQANLLAKYADAASHSRAIEITRKSGLYPRDVLLAAMRGRLYQWNSPDGWRWFPVAAIDDISESLDVLAQTIGSVLVRATDRWRAPPVGILGDVLTNQGPAASPIWFAPSAGGGITQEQLPATPIVPDNTKSSYELDVTQYTNVNLGFMFVGFASNSRFNIELSVDGGSTWKTGAADYQNGYVNAAIDAWTANPRIYGAALDSTANQNGSCYLTNLRAGRCLFQMIASYTASQVIFRTGWANFDGPITDIKITSLTGANFNAGTIRVVGEK